MSPDANLILAQVADTQVLPGKPLTTPVATPIPQAAECLASEGPSSDQTVLAYVENLQFPLCHVNAAEKLIYINRRFVELFGYTLEDVPTLSDWWCRAYPDESYRTWVKETWFKAVAEAQERGTPIRSVEYRVTGKDGTQHPMEISGILLGGDLLATFVDQSDRHAEQERANELLARLQKFAARVPGLMFQYQQWPDGRSAIPYASPGIRDVYGVTPEAVAEDAAPVFKVIHPQDRERVTLGIRESMQTLNTWHDIHRVLLPDGRTLWLEGESEPEAMPDGSVIWHGYIRDITRAREDQGRLRTQLDELRRWQGVMLDREDRILALKREINALLARLGEPPRYPSADTGGEVP